MRHGKFTQGFIASSALTLALGAGALWLLGPSAHKPRASRGLASADCPERVAGGGDLTLYQIPFRDGRCMVNFGVNQSSDVPYRTFSFYNTGVFMVFNSFGNVGTLSRTTGSRVYYLFPRSTNPSFEILDGETLSIALPNGQTAQFSTTTGRALSMSNIHFTEAPEIRRDNQSGFEITSVDQGLVLDCGWRQGGNACALRGPARSTLRDSQGHTCRLNNSELFEFYETDNNRLKFATDAELASFLAVRCPTLDLRSLLPAPEPSQSPIPQ
jgi:hypothetical protein